MITKIPKSFFTAVFFLIAMISIFAIGTPKSLATFGCGSMGLSGTYNYAWNCGGGAWNWSIPPDTKTCTVIPTNAAEAAAYRYVNLSIQTCVTSAMDITLDGVEIKRKGTCGCGGCPPGTTDTWPNFDMGMGVPLIVGRTYTFECRWCTNSTSGSYANCGIWIPAACSLTADPDAVMTGETSILTWTTSGAASATLDGTAIPAAELASGSKPGVGAGTHSLVVTDSMGSTTTCTADVVNIVPPTGGLVPCGRLADDPATTFIDEQKPCDLCAAFYMLKKAINFAMELSVAIAVFIIVIAGLLYAFSAGNYRNIEIAKSAVTYALLGLAIIFIAWLVVAIILNAMGYAGIATWNQVNCSLQT